VKSLMLFYKEMLADAGMWCDISTMRDYETVTHRVEAEGLSFLTITLTDYGKDLEKALDRGFVAHDLFKAFAFTAGLPRLFGGFLELVFDRSTGRLLDSPSIVAIQSLRQLTLVFGKIGLECAPFRVRAAIDKYVQCESDVRSSDRLFPPYEDAFKRLSHLLFGDMFSAIDQMVFNREIVPKHSGGSTADGFLGNRKYYQHEWTERLDDWFPARDFLVSRPGLYDPTNYTHLEPGAERPVKVITVPKTLKTPRIIAMEPVAMQYAQQGLLIEIARLVKSDKTLHSLIGFSDQTPNQRMALKGSQDGTLATLDLSEASDRVSNQHVLSLLSDFPHFSAAVQACRSRTADVSGYGEIRLAKFASMGSALCFPFEAMVFLTVVLMGVEHELSRQLTEKDVKSMLGKVRVYGDDIVVPSRFVTSVVAQLEAFGFIVGLHKSFWTGKFRESCGKEYYDGVDVSIVRCRSLFPTSQTEVPELISSISFRDQLYQAGYWKAVRYLDRLIGDKIPFPAVGPDSPALGKVSFLGYESQRTDRDLQLPMVRAMKVKYHLPKNSVDGHFALLKYFLHKRHELLPEEEILPNIEPLGREHLERSGRPFRATIREGWVRAY